LSLHGVASRDTTRILSQGMCIRVKGKGSIHLHLAAGLVETRRKTMFFCPCFHPCVSLPREDGPAGHDHMRGCAGVTNTSQRMHGPAAAPPINGAVRYEAHGSRCQPANTGWGGTRKHRRTLERPPGRRVSKLAHPHARRTREGLRQEHRPPTWSRDELLGTIGQEPRTCLEKAVRPSWQRRTRDLCAA